MGRYVKQSQKFTDAFFRKKLSADEYKILRQKGTEPPFSGRYLYWDRAGFYCCRGCGQKIFLSRYKFHSDSGWPSFHKAVNGAVELRPDIGLFMLQNEVICSRCHSHLGHLFFDDTLGGHFRYCINSAALEFHSQPKKMLKS